MVDKKITELVELTTPAAVDIIAIVDDPSGSPVTKKITYANLESNLSITASQVSDFDTEVTNNSTVAAKMDDMVDDTTPQLGGDLDWNSNGTQLVSQTVGGANGNVVYLSGTNAWTAADATAESTCSNLLGIRISATNVLTIGVYTTTGLTAGSIYYVSETTGAITTTAPTTSTSIVRVVGYALSTTELFVNPDGTWVENA